MHATQGGSVMPYNVRMLPHGRAQLRLVAPGVEALDTIARTLEQRLRLRGLTRNDEALRYARVWGKNFFMVPGILPVIRSCASIALATSPTAGSLISAASNVRTSA